MFDLMKKLTLSDGISGREYAVRDVIIKEIEGICEHSTDALGNLICFKKGSRESEKTVMLCSHMDEVGFVVNFITEDGFLKFTPVGGIDTRVMISKRVFAGSERVPGVIGAKATHQLKQDEKETIPEVGSLYIDIGAGDRDGALKYVKLFDQITFDSDYREFGDGLIKAKALDDRAGNALMIEIMKSELPYDTYFVFTAQEEVGLRGAKTAAYGVEPDIAVIVEATTAADIPGVAEDKRVCELGGGPVISFMDGGTIYDKELYELAFSVAKEHNIPCQVKSLVAGGNDAGAVHVSKTGVRTLAVSLPCRYLHSPSCVISKEDVNNTFKLLTAIIPECR